MIIFRKMEQKRAPDFIDLIESSLNRHAVIGDGSIGLRLHCEQKGQLAAQAVAHCANLAIGAVQRTEVIGRYQCIGHSKLRIEPLHQLGGTFAIGRRIKVDIGLLTPEEIGDDRSEEHTSELQSLMRISYAVFCLKKKNNIFD